MNTRIIISRFRLLACFLLSGALMACNQQDAKDSQPQLVSIADAVSAGGATHVQYPATTEARNNADLAFKVAGTIEQVLVHEGDHVSKGQVVARLDPRDYATQLRATESEYRQVKAECERVIAMHAEQAVSDNNYDKARSGLERITEKLNNHRDQLNDCVLRSPYDGFVDHVFRSDKELAGPGIPVLSIYSSGSCDVVVNVPERAYLQLKKNATYVATFSSQPEKQYPLSMKSIASKANADHLYELRLVFKSAPSNITPGMSAMVSIDFDKPVDISVEVPTGAVWAEGQNSYVYVLNDKDNTIRKTKVSCENVCGNGTVVITQGLSAGAKVVASGVRHLADGQKVRVKSPASALNVGNLK